LSLMSGMLLTAETSIARSRIDARGTWTRRIANGNGRTGAASTGR
jgi:hypothetical protein